MWAFSSTVHRQRSLREKERQLGKGSIFFTPLKKTIKISSLTHSLLFKLWLKLSIWFCHHVLETTARKLGSGTEDSTCVYVHKQKACIPHQHQTLSLKHLGINIESLLKIKYRYDCKVSDPSNGSRKCKHITCFTSYKISTNNAEHLLVLKAQRLQNKSIAWSIFFF